MFISNTKTKGVGIAQSVYRLGFELEDRGSVSGTGVNYFLFPSSSVPASGTTYPPIQWLLGILLR